MSRLILPKRELIKPSRRAFIAGGAALIASPAIVRAQSDLTMMGFGQSGAASGGSTPSYAYLGFNSVTDIEPGPGWTFPVTMPGHAGLLVLFLGVQGTTATLTSVVYDPTGANVTLNPDVLIAAGSSTLAMYSGVVSSATGSKNVAVSVSGGSLEFFEGGTHAWLAQNLSSSVKQHAVSGAAGSLSISVTAGDFMFGGIFGVGGLGGGSYDWLSSTQAPAAVHLDATNNLSASPDWTILATNAAFSAQPLASGGTTQVYSTYH